MRLELLHESGGIYVDHDAFVLRPLDNLRRVCGEGVIGGLERFSSAVHKLNNGVLLAARNASFLRLWLESYADYRPDQWDYNSCVRPFELWRLHPSLAQPLEQLAPLTRFSTQQRYDEYLARASVVHVTGLMNAPWRQADVRRFGIMRAIASRVMAAVSESGTGASELVQRCARRAAVHVMSTW
jgi:hypothetical protein